MAIIYDEINKIFNLQTKNSSYIMGLVYDSYLVHIHYGKRLNYTAPVSDMLGFSVNRGGNISPFDYGNVALILFLRNFPLTAQICVILLSTQNMPMEQAILSLLLRDMKYIRAKSPFPDFLLSIRKKGIMQKVLKLHFLTRLKR